MKIVNSPNLNFLEYIEETTAIAISEDINHHVWGDEKQEDEILENIEDAYRRCLLTEEQVRFYTARLCNGN